MEHADALELIDLAAVEPGGLDRLAAGDTPEAAAVAGHVAGCPACAAELARTARITGIARDAIRELPDPALKARTIAFVRAVGIDRSGRTEATSEIAGDAARAASVTAGGANEVTGSPAIATLAAGAPVAARVPGAAAVGVPLTSATPLTDQATARGDLVPLVRPRSRRPLWFAAASLAAVVVAAVAGFAAGGAVMPQPGDSVMTVMIAAKTTMHIAEQGDAAHVVLASTTGSASGGGVLYSVTTGELSMTATGLEPVPSGATYACWVEVNGQRRRIGVLYVEGTEGTWAGVVSDLGSLGTHPAFGVSLVKAGDTSGTPVLRGNG